MNSKLKMCRKKQVMMEENEDTQVLETSEQNYVMYNKGK